MIKLSRLADYGIVISTHLARRGRSLSAAELASATHVPQPTVSKILKALVRKRLLVSQRGALGGYGLAREARSITVAEVVEALEGPIAITSCVDSGGHDCGIEHLCSTRGSWHRVNVAIRDALNEISLAEMAMPATRPDLSVLQVKDVATATA